MQARARQKASAVRGMAGAEGEDMGDFEDNIRTRLFAWSNTYLTRFEMLKMVFETVALGILIYHVAFIKTHVETQREMCSALEDSFNTPFEFVLT